MKRTLLAAALLASCAQTVTVEDVPPTSNLLLTPEKLEATRVSPDPNFSRLQQRDSLLKENAESLNKLVGSGVGDGEAPTPEPAPTGVGVEVGKASAPTPTYDEHVSTESPDENNAITEVELGPATTIVAAIPQPWRSLSLCESHGQWDYNPATADWGSRIFEGGLQFHPKTWDGFRPADYPDAAYKASPAQQIAVAERVLAAQGWGAWPACSKRLGLR